MLENVFYVLLLKKKIDFEYSNIIFELKYKKMCTVAKVSEFFAHVAVLVLLIL